MNVDFDSLVNAPFDGIAMRAEIYRIWFIQRETRKIMDQLYMLAVPCTSDKEETPDECLIVETTNE